MMTTDTDLDDRLDRLQWWFDGYMAVEHDVDRLEAEFKGIREAVKSIRANEAAKERERWAAWFVIPAEHHINSNTKHTLYDVVIALRTNKGPK